MISTLILLLALIGLSAFFSSSEMAYASANRLRIENAMESGSKRAKVAFSIYNKYDDALSAILVGNNLVNISASSIATYLAIRLAGSDRYSALATAIITILIIIFGETIPKIVAKKNANRLALRSSYLLWAIMVLLRPVAWVIVGLVRLITRPLKGEQAVSDQVAVEELVSIIETVEDEGVIDEERSELLQAAIDFPGISASEAMTSRVDMEAIDIDDDWDEILNFIDNCTHTRLPVYRDSIDNIIGVLSLNHFFKALIDNERVDIESLLIPPCYVYKTLKLPSVLSELRKNKTHIAIVTDDYGGTMGIITMEDVLEQIVGDIWDETDEIVDEILQVEPGTYLVDGDMSIYDFLECIDKDEEEFDTDSSTVGGWTLEMFSGFPNQGDSFTAENLCVTVMEMDGLRVEKVLIKVDRTGEAD